MAKTWDSFIGETSDKAESQESQRQPFSRRTPIEDKVSSSHRSEPSVQTPFVPSEVDWVHLAYNWVELGKQRLEVPHLKVNREKFAQKLKARFENPEGYSMGIALRRITPENRVERISHIVVRMSERYWTWHVDPTRIPQVEFFDEHWDYLLYHVAIFDLEAKEDLKAHGTKKPLEMYSAEERAEIEREHNRRELVRYFEWESKQPEKLKARTPEEQADRDERLRGWSRVRRIPANLVDTTDDREELTVDDDE